jgi:hypothetical protein
MMLNREGMLMSLAKRMLNFSSVLLFAALAPLSTAQDVDCTMCHDSAPVSGDHMPMDEVSVEACTMCHAAESDDLFFRRVHDQHGEDLGCDACHEDASDERKAKLQGILGG